MPRLARRLAALEGPMPRAKHDPYGKPLPALVEAPDTRAHRRNITQRQRMVQALLVMLEDVYSTVLRQDVTARVTLSFVIDRGILGDDIEVSVSRRHRTPREEWTPSTPTPAQKYSSLGQNKTHDKD